MKRDSRKLFIYDPQEPKKTDKKILIWLVICFTLVISLVVCLVLI